MRLWQVLQEISSNLSQRLLAKEDCDIDHAGFEHPVAELGTPTTIRRHEAEYCCSYQHCISIAQKTMLLDWHITEEAARPASRCTTGSENVCLLLTDLDRRVKANLS